MSTTKDKSGPAFPTDHTVQFSGMTLRDYFAAKAMQAAYSIYANDAEIAKHWTIMGVAESAYSMADAMIEARKS